MTHVGSVGNVETSPPPLPLTTLQWIIAQGNGCMGLHFGVTGIHIFLIIFRLTWHLKGNTSQKHFHYEIPPTMRKLIHYSSSLPETKTLFKFSHYSAKKSHSCEGFSLIDIPCFWLWTYLKLKVCGRPRKPPARVGSQAVYKAPNSVVSLT